METAIVLLLIYVVAVLIVFPIWAVIKIRRQAELLDALAERIETLSRDARKAATPAAPSVPSTPAVSPAVRAASPAPAPSIATPLAPPPVPPPLPPVAPAPIPRPPVPIVVPPVIRESITTPKPDWLPSFNWEQFMGVKLFSWLGGLALFLGVAFFLKYSFEHELVPPEVRVALGFLLGISLVAGGVLLSRKKYVVTAQTLCASGIVILYAVTFACRSIYHFEFFGPGPTLALMVLITTTAFLLAIRLDARVVAILGMLGGFLTPVLLSTGQDNPLGLFAYIALLDSGLVAVALNRRWHFLVPLGAGGTVAMEVGWASRFLVNENVLTAMLVCLTFDGLFLGASALARRFGQESRAFRLPLGLLVAVSFLFAGYFIAATHAGRNPVLLFGYVFLADACLLIQGLFDAKGARLSLGAGLAVFGLLVWWTADCLRPETLNAGLGCYFAFAVIHAAFPIVLEKRRPGAAPSWWAQLYPPLALVLTLFPALSASVASFALWPVILIIDLLAIILAWISASLVALAVVLTLTLVAAGACVFNVPATASGLPSLLLVIAGFALLFFIAGIWFVRKFGNRLAEPGRSFSWGGDFRAQLPAMSALLPFILLVMVIARVPMTDPTPVFGFALLLGVLTFGLSRWLVLEWLPACALGGILAVAYTWQGQHPSSTSAGTVLAWAVAFHLGIAAFPFVFHKVFADTRGPWITGAASGPLFFPLIYSLVQRTWPNDVLGLIPLAFALPALAALVAVLRLDPADQPRRLGRLALYGGVTLLFITLIFPIQFERQWITLSWALEGAALLWLFHRVPHRGLPIAATILLFLVFARLALNPAVLSYHAHSTMPVLNWYFYTYGIAAGSLLIGARLLAPPRDRVLRLPMPAALNSLAGILLFLLVNIEIADFFSPPDSYQLTFDFSGNFARDMSYTVAWGLFAFALLMLGIWKRSRGARYSALGLLGATLLKLFFHDLASLAQLYRVGALFAVAIIAILASFIYQRFLPANEKKP